jgi:predicted phosphodiesterase
MRLAILADVHGNLPALQAVLADAQRQGADGFIVAGDITGGPDPVRAMNLLRSLDIWMVRGNREQDFVIYDAGDAPLAWRESDQWATRRWSYHSLDRDTLDFIASLPLQRVISLPGCAPIRVLHGSPQDPLDGCLYPDRDPASLRVFREARLLPPDHELPELELALAPVREPVLVCGHTHIPWQQEQHGCLALNPGSVGLPFGGTRARYALLTWRAGHWQATLRAIAYDLEQIRAAYVQSGLLAQGGPFARTFLLVTQTGQNVPGHFVRHTRHLAAEAGWTGGNLLPAGVWERAIATFDWETYT